MNLNEYVIKSCGHCQICGCYENVHFDHLNQSRYCFFSVKEGDKDK